MKKLDPTPFLILPILLFFFSFSFSQNQEVIIEGIVDKHLICDEEIILQGGGITLHTRAMEGENPEEGQQTFNFSFSIPHQKDLNLICFGASRTILVAPSDTVKVRVEGDNCQNIQVSFSSAPLNRLNQLIQQKRNLYMAFSIPFDSVTRIEPLDFLTQRQNMLSQRKKGLDQELKQFSSTIQDWFQMDEMNNFRFSLLQYLMYRKMQNEEITDAEKQIFKDELNSIYQKIHDTGKISNAYHNFIQSYYQYYYGLNQIPKDSILHLPKRRINELLVEGVYQLHSEYAQNYLLSNYLSSAINSGDFSETFINYHLESINHPFYKEKVEIKLQDFKYLSKTDINESKVTLRDLSETEIKGSVLDIIQKESKGKVTLWDIWATWCGSCIRNFSHTKYLKREYKNRDFQVIYIAVRSDRAIWEKVIKNHQLTGVQYLLNQEQYDELKKVLKMNGLPHYAILQKDGSFFQKSSGTPYSEIMKPILETLLEKE